MTRTTLPGRAYTDPTGFEHELNAVLRPAWHCIGRANELIETGSYLTATILDEPIVLVRGDDGALRALSNICRHRGMPVASGAGSATTFNCPYHAWSYATDGKLRVAPYTEPTAVDGCRLPEWPITEWMGFVYVAVTLEPQPFVPSEALNAAVAPYNPDRFQFVHAEGEEWACNWKAMVENFMEGSHLSTVHRTSLHHLTPTRLASKGPSDPQFTSFYSAFPPDLPSRGPGEATLTDEQRTRSLLYQVFPTQVVSQNASFLATFLVLPRSIDRTWIRWSLSAHPDCDAATIQGAIDMWQTINPEDRAILERLQRSLQAPSAQTYAGPLADTDREGTISDFHDYLFRVNPGTT